MDVFGIRALENILYRSDTIEERVELLHKFVYDHKLTIDEFKRLFDCCTNEQLKRDLKRRNG